MSLNPLNELKRRLTDDNTPLPKRFCLAKNIVNSPHFPTAPKERVIAEWLGMLTEQNKVGSKELKDVIKWLDGDDITGELKSQLIQVVSQYLRKNPLQSDNVQCIVSFLEHPKIFTQLTIQVDDFLYISTNLLQYLRSESNDIEQSRRILKNLVKYYKDCKKKLEFIIKLLDGEHLETLFSYLHTENHNTVLHVCENILFPMNKKSFFISFLQTLIRKDNIDELIAEKGDNIQSVLKIMSTFFTYPKGRTDKNPNFLTDFINLFVSCFKNESQMIFAFYVMVVNSLNIDQSYISPAMKMPPIIFENDEKVKRKLFHSMLETLLTNEVDINVRLTDTFGEKVSKVEIKKNFTSFLQTVMMGQLKLEGKLDKTTLQIIKTAMKLEPILIEQKMDQILPPVMIAKKNSTSLQESYKEMLNCLLEILFKLSRGIPFLNQILPNVKLYLEAGNPEQFEIKQKIKHCSEEEAEYEKLLNKIVCGKDIFPEECVEMYGKLTSELMFRQNTELLLLLQKDFEEYCLMMLEEGFVSPSIITLTEVLSAILASFLHHCKMADHTVPQQIATDFWSAFKQFEKDCLQKFGECVLKLNYNSELATSFLRLSVSVAHLKLLNIKYSNTKIDITSTSTSDLYDLSIILPFLNSEQWSALASKLTEDTTLLWCNLLLAKTIAISLLSYEDQNDSINTTKNHLIKQITTTPILLETSGFPTTLFANIDKAQAKLLAKNLVKLYLNNPELHIFKSEAVINNKLLLQCLILETSKTIAKCFENNDEFAKEINKSKFELAEFVKNVDIKKYFEEISLKEDQHDVIEICIDIFKQLPVCYVEENYQFVAIFELLLIKKCCQKKTRKNVDHILQNIFELSSKHPDLYKVFSVDFIFSFEDRTLINLLTLKIKTSNNMLIIKSILETAVKKVKTDSDVVKNLVELLLSKQNKNNDASSIEYFSDPAFQMSCIILPIIAKEKRAISTSAYRSILATLQEKLHKSMLDAFKNIDFMNSSLLNETNGNTDESMVISESTMAALNAIGAYSLTLSRYCESSDGEEIKNLDCLWSGLEFFMQNAIQAIQNPSAKSQHVDSSIQLLVIILRYIKKLESHPVFEKKDQVFIQMWRSITQRLLINEKVAEDVAVTLKYLGELTSVEIFVNTFIGDLNGLLALKKPKELSQDHTLLTAQKVFKYLLTQILKANIIGPKCAALSKLMFKYCKALRVWLQEHFLYQEGRKERINDGTDDVREIRVIRVSDAVCNVLKIDLEALAESILAAKKISLDYKFLDSIFELQHLIHFIMGVHSPDVRVDVSHESTFKLFEGCMAVLNTLLVSREELLEDRWPCYMQCFRALVQTLCGHAASRTLTDRAVEDKLAEIAHSVEKLTQSICKRKSHVSRIASYSVADICSLLERTGPTKIVRQHLENSIALLIQASDSSYTAAFLRRALAGAPGHMTLGNMYTMYKRYHKYVGNS